MNKQAQISNVLRDENPPLATKFNDAVENQDTAAIASLMSSMSQLPLYKTLIQPGIGWDGVVTNPAEKEAVRAEIMNSQFPNIQKMKHIEALDSSGTIPVKGPTLEIRRVAKQAMRNNGRKVEGY